MKREEGRAEDCGRAGMAVAYCIVFACCLAESLLISIPFSFCVRFLLVSVDVFSPWSLRPRISEGPRQSQPELTGMKSASPSANLRFTRHFTIP